MIIFLVIQIGCVVSIVDLYVQGLVMCVVDLEMELLIEIGQVVFVNFKFDFVWIFSGDNFDIVVVEGGVDVDGYGVFLLCFF